MKTMQDYDNLINACRLKTLKKGERYTALEMVLTMLLKCGVTAQEIPYIWIEDVTDKNGAVKDTFPSYLYVDEIDTTPIQSELQDYLVKLNKWNKETNRIDPRLFPSIPRYQTIQRSLKILDPTFTVSDIDDLAKKQGFPRRPIRSLEKRPVYDYDSLLERFFNLDKEKDFQTQTNNTEALLKDIQNTRKVNDLEVWGKLEKHVKNHLDGLKKLLK